MIRVIMSTKCSFFLSDCLYLTVTIKFSVKQVYLKKVTDVLFMYTFVYKE